ncbi:hypothetical protein PROH_15675 [Prochlorothrix hollandica PCC 9006 = CALU 1027]|uniref:Uncharacterized protein n=1 Tax=Prochlorothrix hollandica PCC 9006 = CALU 1027 TaxID=317619 RepID=A0A0M2PVR9_PROHO|nr:hypothetical protein PROH_15675 [Prochlorothrix hollandica PCC 9006 = CALU 1027]
MKIGYCAGVLVDRQNFAERHENRAPTGGLRAVGVRFSDPFPGLGWTQFCQAIRPGGFQKCPEIPQKIEIVAPYPPQP